MKLESKRTRRKIFKPNHELPGPFRLNYILLPFGDFYDKSKKMMSAKGGDTLRFFNGPDVIIDSVLLVDGASVCDALCRIRYGIPWRVAIERWRQYARMEGHEKSILSDNKCILITYKNVNL